MINQGHFVNYDVFFQVLVCWWEISGRMPFWAVWRVDNSWRRDALRRRA
ncbi:hypothetical protein ACZ87_02663 [Candidatus Erwinia dacicola]|uniref:Uncharacterized protein n=1 Tax=Candidatus Erwinia dacicola TaxID=252393 RepID=A0A328TS33_9GAMM|nr:hypothetical protein ACZ87_02663 [Candidatus Erwinia dacicola]